jgi:hypothetical protein
MSSNTIADLEIEVKSLQAKLAAIEARGVTNVCSSN